MRKSFNELCKETGTDKVGHHGYHYYYPTFLETLRNDSFNLLEIGYGEGKSMKMWSEYFPKCDIYCADVNVELVINDRSKVLKVDQSDPEDLKKLVEQIRTAKLIIDDGSHNPKHQFDSFKYLFNYLLEPGGIYIIEDIETSYWNSNAILYGYKIGEFNLMKKITECHDMINHEFSGKENELKISSISYGQNCIIIKKRTEEEDHYFNRKYRFNHLVR